MIPLKKIASVDRFMGMIYTASVLIVTIALFSLTGCAAVVDRSGESTPTTISDNDSNPCGRMLKATWSTALGPTEGGQCGSRFPEATIYRDDEANLNTQTPHTSNLSQAGMFTPFWVIF